MQHYILFSLKIRQKDEFEMITTISAVRDRKSHELKGGSRDNFHCKGGSHDNFHCKVSEKKIE